MILDMILDLSKDGKTCLMIFSWESGGFLRLHLTKPPWRLQFRPLPEQAEKLTKEEGNPARREREALEEVKMEKVVLKATPRTLTGRHVRALRRTGQLRRSSMT